MSYPFTNQVALEAWIHMSQRPAVDRWCNVAGKPEYYLYIYGRQAGRTLLSAFFHIGGEVDIWNAGTMDLPPNTWIYLVLTFNGSQIRAYVKGEFDWARNRTSTIRDSSSNNLRSADARRFSL